MSNQSERDELGDLLFAEFALYAEALSEQREGWEEAWPSVTWPPHTLMATLQGRFAVARKAAAVVGVKPSDSEITDEHKARVAFRSMFPDGAPAICD
ncbi:hypothetical protein OG728_39325 (plasmid) [Streptomyces microflavus]|uniref:hypothetical protein n=1 Tax=Streptomyces microflavus TaxID=1919 RepID=UPI002E136F44|nr:hypothetical protein OG728_39325 [Streptomyces microflavus]